MNNEAITPEQKRIVQTTWERVVPIAGTAARLFYGRLFELDPSLRDLFGDADIEEQGRKLMQTLTLVVRGLDRLDRLVPAVEGLGRRHVAYGVRPGHYETVGAALLWTLEHGLGDAFTAEVRDAWAAAYRTIADIMRGATPLAVGARSV